MPAEIVIPPGLPLPLADGHGFEPKDPCINRPKDQGELRRMPVYSSMPQMATVRWRLTQAQFDLFWAWYESDLHAGALEFDLQLAAQGSASPGAAAAWWTAQFMESPDCQVLRGGRYLVASKLLVTGVPAIIRVAPGIRAAGLDSDSGHALFGQVPFAASGDDVDGGAYYPYFDGIVAAGDEIDAGGWM